MVKTTLPLLCDKLLVSSPKATIMVVVQRQRDTAQSGFSGPFAATSYGQRSALTGGSQTARPDGVIQNEKSSQ